MCYHWCVPSKNDRKRPLNSRINQNGISPYSVNIMVKQTGDENTENYQPGNYLDVPPNSYSE